MGLKIALKASGEDEGGMGEVTDIGRWSEKKDAKRTSREQILLAIVNNVGW